MLLTNWLGSNCSCSRKAKLKCHEAKNAERRLRGVGHGDGGVEKYSFVMRLVAYRTIAEEDSVRVQSHGFVSRVASRHNRDFASKRGQAPQNVVFDAKIIGYNLKPE